MKRILLLFAWLLGILSTIHAQVVLKEPLSSRQTYYNINARLDIPSKTVMCNMVAYWVNKSEDIVPDIQLHMYMNAFRRL